MENAGLSGSECSTASESYLNRRDMWAGTSKKINWYYTRLVFFGLFLQPYNFLFHLGKQSKRTVWFNKTFLEIQRQIFPHWNEIWK